MEKTSMEDFEPVALEIYISGVAETTSNVSFLFALTAYEESHPCYIQ